MISYQGRGWYLRKVGKNPKWGYFLHYCHNMLGFNLLVESLGESDILVFMTWRGLVELLDCIIPAGHNPEDPANTGITLQTKNYTVTILTEI